VSGSLRTATEPPQAPPGTVRAGAVARLQSGLARPLSWLDTRLDRLYGSRLNPLYHSGAIVVALLVVLLLTGVYLLLFWRVGAPYESTARITEQVWAGRWIRSLHRFASDAAVIAIAVHTVRMFVQRRTWGPRLLAWMSGVILLAVFMISGWTGYVLIWDVQGQAIAVAGSRVLDVLPILSEPLSRAFVGEQPVPDAFFFVNLFLHVALPIGMGLLLWLHVARVARPVLLPARPVLWGILGLLTAASILWPIGMSPRADPFSTAQRGDFDVFFSFWIPLAEVLHPLTFWALASVLGLAFFLVPFWAKPRGGRPPPSVVDERRCTACEQCVLDCPFEAIEMVARTDGRPGLVARVDPGLCVSCGICIASCAPMGVGPGRTGRDQLAEARAFVASGRAAPGSVVLVACTRGAGGAGALRELDGSSVYPVPCTGSLHTSVLEHLVRSGIAGVMVAGCPPEDCWNREGAQWLEERVMHGREAELQERVDRRRVRLTHASLGDHARILSELRAFRAEVPPVALDDPEGELDLIALCERAPEGSGR
jgi:ferredoxin